MRHRNSVKTLGRVKASREALIEHVVTSLILYERIHTTRAKAKAARSMAERLVHLGATNTLQTRRMLMKYLKTKGAIEKVLDVLGPKYATRTGGYLRMTALGRRQGDNAEMVELSFV
ncbi:50S ribosomal protein L17 [Candidatus Uhrbacteria bacterium]|nr:50S ribosomal protein L17 [Candidatus Uhrbacteria bacterium]